MTLQALSTGLVYRNPKPYLRAVNAWHPTLVGLPGGEWFCSFDLGQGPESLDYRTYFSRSSDGGATWSAPQRLARDTSRPERSHTLRVGRLRDGTMVGMGVRYVRSDPEEGTLNRDNLGMAPLELIQVRSADAGRTWSQAQVQPSPLDGPAFEVCHPVVELRDGRCLWPTSTWRGWDGREPQGMKAVALVSHDKGATWSGSIDVIDQYAQGVFTWEQSLTELSDGRLAAIGWSYHEKSGQSRANACAVSQDGKRFGPMRTVALNGETAKLLRLDDDRLLCAYRRVDQPGLWGAVLSVEGDGLKIHEQVALWQGSNSVVQGAGKASDNLSKLRFGYPSLTHLGGGEVAIAFWACEEDVFNIRWVRVKVG